jgi:hypothetical protein
MSGMALAHPPFLPRMPFCSVTVWPSARHAATWGALSSSGCCDVRPCPRLSIAKTWIAFGAAASWRK